MENEPQDAYLPHGDTEALEPFDVRQQSSRRGMMWLVGGIVFLLVLLLVIMNLFSSGTRDKSQTPTILADNSPYKIVPEERGGVQTPNQDKEIYQKLNGTLEEVPVQVVPVAEIPLPKPVKPKANIVIKEPTTSTPKSNAGTSSTVSTSTPTVQPRPTAVSSDYVVQVASLRSRAEAERLWVELRGKMGTLMNFNHSSDIMRADLGTKGIYYRLRVSGLADKAAADALCAQFKTRKQDCIVTKK